MSANLERYVRMAKGRTSKIEKHGLGIRVTALKSHGHSDVKTAEILNKNNVMEKENCLSSADIDLIGSGLEVIIASRSRVPGVKRVSSV